LGFEFRQTLRNFIAQIRALAGDKRNSQVLGKIVAKTFCVISHDIASPKSGGREANRRHLSSDLALAYCNTLAAGHPDAEPEAYIT
jgi:hypothetical protein